MDAAHSEKIRGALASQGRFIGAQEEHLQEMLEQVTQLPASLAQVAKHLASPDVSLGLKFITPDKFNDDPAKCCGFLLQCHLYLTSQGDLSDHSKIVLRMGLLIGKALT